MSTHFSRILGYATGFCFQHYNCYNTCQQTAKLFSPAVLVDLNVYCAVFSSVLGTESSVNVIKQYSYKHDTEHIVYTITSMHVTKMNPFALVF